MIRNTIPFVISQKKKKTKFFPHNHTCYFVVFLDLNFFHAKFPLDRKAFPSRVPYCPRIFSLADRARLAVVTIVVEVVFDFL